MPACAICPWVANCAARQAGIQSDLPRKLAKPDKPTRTGTVWLARREDGALLLERRPDRGLLGGTLGFPGDGWDGAVGVAPLATDWHPQGEVRHTFTHFHLILTVQTAQVPQTATPTRGEFLGRNLFSSQDLPTLMRKAHDLAFG
jgi:A/G-specific adenine glycosylase